MRTLVLLEILTALIYGYVGLNLSWNSTPLVIQGLQFTSVFVAGTVIAVGGWRRAQWVPKAALALTAWVGIPTLASVAGVVSVIHEITQPAVVLTFGILLVAAICQLMALWIAMRQLEVRSAAV